MLRKDSRSTRARAQVRKQVDLGDRVLRPSSGAIGVARRVEARFEDRLHDELEVGIRWRSGASEQHTVQRPKTRAEVIRTPAAAIELTRRLAPDRTNPQIAEQLNSAGLRAGTGGPFAAEHVQWIRWRHKIPYPSTWAQDGELTVHQTAERLGVSDGTIYDWIRNDKLHGRRGPGNRLYIPFGPEVEQDCHQLITNSVHLPHKTKIRAAGGAV